MATPVITARAHAATTHRAALFARANGRATRALIQTWLGVGPQQARALMSDLIKRNIIRGPIAGSAVAVQRMHAPNGITGVTKVQSQIASKACDAFNALTQDDDAPAAPVPTEETIDATS